MGAEGAGRGRGAVGGVGGEGEGGRGDTFGNVLKTFGPPKASMWIAFGRWAGLKAHAPSASR